MELIRIYRLAYDGALEVWAREHDHLEQIPDNPFAQYRERKAYEELEAISALLKAEEDKR